MRKQLLEMVPPPLSQGPKGLSRSLTYIDQVRELVALQAVNIPEIHQEPSRNSNGSRQSDFVPRMAPREFAAHIREHCGLDSVVNHVVVHQPIDALARWLDESHSQYGVSQFVLVGGASSRIDYPGPSVREANALARKLFADSVVSIGNICIPHRKGEEKQLQKKCESGADFFTTQIIYELDELRALQRAALAAGLNTTGKDIYISFCLVRSVRNIRFLNWLGVDISEELDQWLDAGPETMTERSLAHISRIWRAFSERIQRDSPPLCAQLNLCAMGNIPAQAIARLATELQRHEPAIHHSSGKRS